MPSPLAQALAFQNATPTRQVTVSPTDVIGAYKLSSDVAEKNYQAKLQQMQAMWGGLASLGAAGILGFGKPWATKYFGAGADKAASGSTGGAANTAAADTAGEDAAGSFKISGLPDTAGTDVISAAPDSLIPGAVPGSVASDLAGTGTGIGTLGADAGLTGSVATDLAAAAPAAGAGADVAAAGLPDFITSLLAFL